MDGGLHMGEGINTTSTNESHEVSQEELVRVSENARKAAQIGGQIRGDQQKNRQLAQFLEFLFDEVKNDTIREIIVALCTVPDSTGRTLTLSLPEMIAFFAPFFPAQIQQFQVDTILQDMTYPDSIQIDTYSNYINGLRKNFPLVAKMDAEKVATLIVAMLEYFGYIVVTEEQKQDTITSIKHYIAL